MNYELTSSPYAHLCRFIRLLPASIPLPEVTTDTDGDILLEWDRGPEEVFTISIGSDGTLHYAALVDEEQTHGTEHLNDTIPETTLCWLWRFAGA